MALGKVTEQDKKYYLTISDGKVVHHKGGRKFYYAFVEGKLESIYLKERTFNGENVLYWYIDIRADRELYSISLPYKSGSFKSIILALASVPSLDGEVRIEPYTKNGYTKVSVSLNGERLDWVTKELPPVDTIQIAGQPVKDDTRRMEYISSLVDKVQQRIVK